MKKSLLALAVLSSIAGAASAQSSVTIYGIVDAGIAHETGAAAGNVTKIATGVQQGNRLGFKGVEDLGNGLKAQFQIENGFNLDDGTQRQGGRLFGRQAYAGLSGGFGEINLGRQYNPLFNVMNAIDPFQTGLEGSTTNLMSGGGLGTNLTPHSADVRVNNSITYSIPATAGFSATALYGAGEVAGNRNAGRTIGLSGSYTNGPLMVAAAYNKVTAQLTGIAVTVPDSKLALIGGTYNFGVVTTSIGYETEKNDAGLSFKDILVGATVPVSQQSLVLASFMKRTDKSNGLGNAGAKQYAIGYTYNLSKRSNLYTSYARITNDVNGLNYVGDASSGGSAVAAGHTSGGFSVGLRHKF